MRNAIIAVSLKYLSHFWRSLKMLLINWKAESTLDGCVLYVADTEYLYYQRHKIMCSSCNFISKRQSKLSKLRRKRFERSVYCNEYKTKSNNRDATNEFRYFLKSKFFGINRKLTIGQGEDYTTGYLLDQEYNKNYFRLIAVDLSRPKELDADTKAI